MVRTTDFKTRKNKVLAAVIDYYIKTAVPVSSQAIVSKYDFNLSPATLRNVFAELEEDGYLTHPHTSAGRIPTQKGYRYYVDYLMKEMQMIGEEKGRIEAEYRENIQRLEYLLDRTSHTLSDLTHCAGIVSLEDDRLIYTGASFIASQPEFKNIEKIRRILQLLEEKERLLEIINRDLEKKIEIYIGNELACDDIDSCSLVVSHYHARKGQTGSLAVLGPTRMPYSRIVSAVEYMSELIESLVEDF